MKIICLKENEREIIMRKTLKYLLITCVILGAPAYAMDGERILDASGLPISSLTAQWFGTPAN